MSHSLQDAPTHQDEGGAVISLNEAVERAKAWLHATMSGESISNLGLEEVEHQPGYWNITLGFSRPWDEARNAVTVLSGAVVMRRTFKTITVDERTGEIVAMKNRNPDARWRSTPSSTRMCWFYSSLAGRTEDIFRFIKIVTSFQKTITIFFCGTWPYRRGS